MKDLTDLQLMQRVKAGETHFAGTLYERHKTGVYAYFYRCSRDQGVSEDLVQEVFIKVIRYKHQFRDVGEFTHWLYRIARNSWLDHVKKKDPLRQANELDSKDGMTALQMRQNDKEDLSERKWKLKKALELLSPDKKDAIIMSRYQGMDYKTISEICQCSESAIKTRVMRGLLELKQIIKTEAWTN